MIAYPIAILDKPLTNKYIPMRETTVYLHNKLGKQKTNFSVDQLSQALELTSSDETSLEEQKNVWDCDFWKHRYKAGYEPQN
jgi:hypothetical protein